MKNQAASLELPHFTFVAYDEREIKGYDPKRMPKLGYSGYLRDKDPANPLRQFVDEFPADPDNGFPLPGLPMGNTHLPEDLPNRFIAYDRTVFCDQQFSIPVGARDFILFTLEDARGQILVEDHPIAALGQLLNEDRALFLPEGNAVTRAPFPLYFQDEPIDGLVKVTDRINPKYGTGQIGFWLMVRGENFGIYDRAIYTLKPHALPPARV